MHLVPDLITKPPRKSRARPPFPRKRNRRRAPREFGLLPYNATPLRPEKSTTTRTRARYTALLSFSRQMARPGRENRRVKERERERVEISNPRYRAKDLPTPQRTCVVRGKGEQHAAPSWNFGERVVQ